MRPTKKIILTILTLALLLSACDLPVVTPPVTETDTVVAPTLEVPPTVNPTEAVPTPTPARIQAGNAPKLVLGQRAAVSNIQSITWSGDSSLLNLVTQNSDASGNQVFGLTSVNAYDLSTRSVASFSDFRIAAVAADGKTAALLSNDMSNFMVVDLSGGNQQLYSAAPGYLIGSLSFSPDMRYLAVTKAESWEVVLVDLATFQELRTLTGFETAAPVFDAGFSHSPQWVIWHARGTIQLQEVESGTLGPIFSHEDFVIAFDLSADGTLLASAAGKTVDGNIVPAVTIWDTSNGNEVRTLVLSAPANALEFSPDGKLLAVAVGNDLQVWNPADGQLLATLSGHSDQVIKVAFSPDQSAIATSGLDNQLYLWQVLE